MYSDSMDGADKAELFPSETNSHPASSIPHSEFCPLNGASFGSPALFCIVPKYRL